MPDFELPVRKWRRPRKVMFDNKTNSKRIREGGKKYRQQETVETNTYGPYNGTTHMSLTLPSQFHANYRRSDPDMYRYQGDRQFDHQQHVANTEWRDKGERSRFPTLFPAGIDVNKIVDKGIMLYDAYTELARIKTDFFGDAPGVGKNVPIRDNVPGDTTAVPPNNTRPNWLQMASKAADTFTKVQQIIKPLL